jgi:hypothetical protein
MCLNSSVLCSILMHPDWNFLITRNFFCFFLSSALSFFGICYFAKQWVGVVLWLSAGDKSYLLVLFVG